MAGECYPFDDAICQVFLGTVGSRGLLCFLLCCSLKELRPSLWPASKAFPAAGLAWLFSLRVPQGILVLGPVEAGAGSSGSERSLAVW